MKAGELNTYIFESISHVEDLAVDQFIQALRNFENYEISEKVDGANLRFGLDENGFFTTRSKGPGQRFYEIEDYPVNFATTFQRSAHGALAKKVPLLKDAGLSQGDIVEVEVLFGELPNVVPYSSEENEIILLRTVEGDVDVRRLQEVLDGETAQVIITAPYTVDGTQIMLAPEKHDWSFKMAPTWSGDEVLDAIAQQELNRELDKLEDYLKAPSGIWRFSNAEILSIPLNRRAAGVEPSEWADIKQRVKARRIEAMNELHDEGSPNAFIRNVKNVLLSRMVRKISSGFGPDVTDGGWIEGLVFRNKDTGEQFKVIDKDIFTEIKNFLWQVRQELSDKPRSVNKIESFLGKLLTKLANSLGHVELGTVQASRYLKRFGTDPDQVLTVLADGLNFGELREYWSHTIEAAQDELKSKLDQYQDEIKDKKLRVDFDGEEREFSYEGEIDQRTLQVFANMFQELEKFKHGTHNAESAEDLITLLVGEQLERMR